MSLGALATALALGCVPWGAQAAGFAAVRGRVLSATGKPVRDARVELRSAVSALHFDVRTDAAGRYRFASVPLGMYSLSVSYAGYSTEQQIVSVLSGSAPVADFHLPEALQPITVSAARILVPNSITPTTLVSGRDIEHTPGAALTNSQAMITDFVPGAYVVHDMLHLRGGHQTSWDLEGVEIPNTNIASNLGPQLDPRDIDSLAVERGSYGADLGDRTYGIFDVVPKTGAALSHQAEVIASGGTRGLTDDYASVGSHAGPLAYYGSVDGNRSDLGLETPGAQVLHDTEAGYGLFGSVDDSLDAADQLRFVTAARHDAYDIPELPGASLNDVQRESDAFVLGSLLRQFGAGAVLQSSIFYHYNSASYDGAANDFPISTTDRRAASYAGGQEALRAQWGQHELSAGLYAFAQWDSEYFGILSNDGSGTSVRQTLGLSGNLQALWLQDQWRVGHAVHLTAGVRQTWFSGVVHERATSPRLGATWQLPHLAWVLRGFWGRFYQPPPLATLSGPLLGFATQNALAFEPLHGERDSEYQFGITIPIHGWLLDADHFRTAATNFFDHNPIGNSDVFFPITLSGALIRGYELTVRSAPLWSIGRFHLSYSNQVAQGFGAVTGGLQDFSAPTGYYGLDHDQRNTVAAGVQLTLPRQLFASIDVYYGSGFSNGDAGPSHLPSNYSIDLSVGRDFGPNLTATLTALNLTDQHLLIDNSLTFGGTHYNDPLQVYAQLHYRFRY